MTIAGLERGKYLLASSVTKIPWRSASLHLTRFCPVVTQTYSVFEYCLASLAAQKYRYLAIQHLCDARRRVSSLTATARHGRLMQSLLAEAYCRDGQLVPHAYNALLEDFRRSSRYKRSRDIFAHEPLADRRRLRFFRENSPPHRQGNLIILKKSIPETGEKGVLILKYTPTFEQFAATFDLVSLLREYRVVFEPSSYRNIEASLFLFSGNEQSHVLQCAHPDDRKILSELPSSLTMIELGASDWIDPDVFRPAEEAPLHDIVMVASWSRLKRHSAVFRTLADLQKKGQRPTIALIGYPEELKQRDIERCARRHGVLQQCRFFERIPHVEVARIVSRASVAIHFSRAEGTNRASYEAWLCNTPLIVYRHNIGFRMEYVNERTGLLADDHELAGAIDHVLRNRGRFAPRAWLLERSGYRNATRKLNEMLCDIAHRRGEPWTRNIVEKKNALGLVYVNEEVRLEMEPEYDRLEQYLS